MIDKITKGFTYAGKVNYISRRRFPFYLDPEMWENSEISYFDHIEHNMPE